MPRLKLSSTTEVNSVSNAEEATQLVLPKKEVLMKDVQVSDVGEVEVVEPPPPVIIIQREDEKREGATEEDSDNPSESAESKRSLEALFQAAHSELQNMTAKEEPNKGEELSSLLDKTTSIPILIQMSHGTEVQGNLVKVVDDAGKVQLRIKTADAVASPPPKPPSPKPVGRKRKHPQKPGKHICPYCGVGCAKPSVLEKHLRAHTGERPYPCLPCGFSFKTKSNLYKHCKSQSHLFKLAMLKREGHATVSMEEDTLEEEYDDEAHTSSMSVDSEVAVEEGLVSLSAMPQAEVTESPPVAPLPAPAKKMLVRSNAVDEGSPRILPRQMTPEERISWLISNNAAIVDTPMADPPRPKRMSRQSSEVEPGGSQLLNAMPLNGMVNQMLTEADMVMATNSISTNQGGSSPQTSSPQVFFLGLAEPSDQPPGQEDLVMVDPTVAHEEEAAVEKKSLPSEIKIRFKLPKEGVASSLEVPDSQPPSLLAPSVLDDGDSAPEVHAEELQSSQNTDLVIIVHEDGTKEKVLVNRDASTAVVDQSTVKEETELKKPQRGRPKGSRNKVKLKLNIPPTPIQPSTDSPSVQTDDEPGSAVPSWKLKLKGRLLLKRSISMEKGATKQLSLEELHAPRSAPTLKRAHSLGLDQSFKKRMLLDISKPASPEPESECPAEQLVAVKSAVTRTHQSQPLCSGSRLLKEDDNSLPATLTIPLNLAKNIPGLVEEAVPDDAIPDEAKEPRGDVIEHKAVQLCAGSEEMRQKALMTLMLLGHSFPQMATRPCHTFFCSILKPQPMYVAQDSEQGVSMYSNWRSALYNPHLMGLSSKEVLSLYQSNRYSNNTLTTQAATSSSSKTKAGILTHSSFWSSKHSKDYNEAPLISRDLLQIPDLIGSEAVSIIPAETTSATPEVPPQQLVFTRKKLRQILVGKALHPSRVKIFPGGYKSLEEYTYVRGRGRGMYVCEECGIRCKKPSMLRKHLRTHTEFRPYKCEFCEFKFKTKGNLTKHMKSKSHFRRCSEMGLQILSADDIDSPLNAHSEVVISQDGQFSDADEEEEEDEEEDEEAEEEELAQVDSEGLIRIRVNGDTILTVDKGKLATQNSSGDSPRASIDKEIAASLLDLSKGTESEASDPKQSSSSLTNVISALKPNEASSPAPEEVATLASKSSFTLPSLGAVVSSAPSMTSAGFFPPVVSASSGQENVDFVTIVTSKESLRIPVRMTKATPTPSAKEMTPLPGRVPDSQPQKGGKYTCEVCSKQFAKQHELSMHSQVHAFECRFKCSDCQLSFRSQESLDKHLRSEAHQSKVQLNRHFGAADRPDDPRPFKCRDCDVAFRAHGFLARHLRSHQHILQLEGCAKLPSGTAAQLQDNDLKELDTLDCASNLKSILRLVEAKSSAATLMSSEVEQEVVIEDGQVVLMVDNV